MTLPDPSWWHAARRAYHSADWASVDRSIETALLQTHAGLDALLAAMESLCASCPNDPAAPFLRGLFLDRLGRWEQAAGAFAETARLNLDAAAQPFFRMGLALARGGLHAPALHAFDRALGRNPGHNDARFCAAVSLRRLGRVGDALRMLESIPPSRSPQWINNFAEMLLDQGRLDEALPLLTQDESLLRQHAGLHSSLIRARIYDPRAGARDLFEETGRWNAWHGPPPSVSPARLSDPDPERPLRIGYVSSCLFRHNSSAHLIRLLQARDRSRFHVTLYSAGTVHDDWTEILRGLADAWRDISTLPDADADRVIRTDRIDILVDLNEHANNGRLTLFTRKPAPLQFHWYGNAVTTGVAAIDYRFSDAIAEPPGEADRWSHETILRLDTGYHCYGPPPAAAEPDPVPPFQQNGFLTFGAVHHLAKLNTNVLACWRRILETVPSSQLLLARDVLADPDTRQRLLQRLDQAGLPLPRIRLFSDARAIATLAVYHSIDIVLDSFPFNGDATTCDALWMGVPVLTVPGHRLSARRAAGLLHIVGAEEWIAPDENAYVAQAAAWAQHPGDLASARARLLSQVRRSPLCNASAVAGAIETAYRDAWRIACRKNSNPPP